jgi:hypothetical protein
VPRIDDSGYPCTRYVNRKGEFDIENEEFNLVSGATLGLGYRCCCAGKILWNHADKPFTIPWDLYCVTHVHCQMILEDQTLFRQLNASRFDLAIVDLIANECSLALARALHLPVASFWGFAYQGGQVARGPGQAGGQVAKWPGGRWPGSQWPGGQVARWPGGQLAR